MILDEASLLQKAISLREAGDVGGSINLLTKLERTCTDAEKRAVVLANLATSFAAKKDFAAARVKIDAALEQLPASHEFHPYAMLISGSIMQELGEVRQAKEIFERLARAESLKDAEHRELWVDALGRLGCSLVAMNDNKNALPELKHALQASIDPARVQVLQLNLAVASESLGHKADAEAAYKRAMEGPDAKVAIDSRFRLACLLYSQTRYREALELFLSCEPEIVDPDFKRDIYTMLSQTYLSLGNKDLAQKYAASSKRLII